MADEIQSAGGNLPGDFNTLEAKLNAGVAAARNGNKDEARRLLQEVVEEDQNIERAWLALASVVSTTSERRTCLENVLALNPNNEKARSALERLEAAESSASTSSRQTPVIRNSGISSTERTERASDRAIDRGRGSTPSTSRPVAGTKSAAMAAAAKDAVTRAAKNRVEGNITQGTREAWIKQKRDNQISPVLLGTGALVFIVLILFGVSLALNPTTVGTPTPTAVALGYGVTPTRTALPTETLRPTSTIDPNLPTATPLIVVTAATWTPTFTPQPSATPEPTPSLPDPASYSLLFVGEGRGRSGAALYSVVGNGTDERLLFSTDAVISFPAIAPGGDKLVYVAIGENGSPQLFVSGLDGKEPAPLTTYEADKLEAPSWSPDGERIAFVTNKDRNDEIYIVNADGSNEVRFTENNGSDSNPVWLNDGSGLIWSQDTVGRGSSQLVSQQFDSRQVVELTNSQGSNTQPSISPDGQIIAFTSTRDGKQEIYLMAADGTDEQLITFDDGDANNSDPAWSPDGQYIVFTSNRNGGVKNLYSMTPDGNNVQQITNQNGSSFYARFIR